MERFTPTLSLNLGEFDTEFTWVKMFFGHFDCRLFISDTAYVDIGRGSLSIAPHLKFNIPGFKGCVGTVGQFCNVATCTVFAGGEHGNDLPVNVTFGAVPLFDILATQEGIHDLRPLPQQPFAIGDAVVLSANCMVLPGARIGTGTVLAAGAAARGRLDEFSIYAGLPARKIRDRQSQEIQQRMRAVRWWDFDTLYLLNNLARLQALAIDTETPHRYRQPTPRLAWRLTGDKFKLIGFDDGTFRPLDEAPAKLRDYLAQCTRQGPGTFLWHADVWN